MQGLKLVSVYSNVVYCDGLEYYVVASGTNTICAVNNEKQHWFIRCDGRWYKAATAIPQQNLFDAEDGTIVSIYGLITVFLKHGDSWIDVNPFEPHTHIAGEAKQQKRKQVNGTQEVGASGIVTVHWHGKFYPVIDCRGGHDIASALAVKLATEPPIWIAKAERTDDAAKWMLVHKVDEHQMDNLDKNPAIMVCDDIGAWMVRWNGTAFEPINL